MTEDWDRDPEDLTTLIKGGRKKQALRSWGDPPISIPDTPEVPRSSSHKDTKRWCRGVVGREHVRKILTYEETLTNPQQKERYRQDLEEKKRLKAEGKPIHRWWFYTGRNTIICVVCHKHLGWEEKRDQ